MSHQLKANCNCYFHPEIYTTIYQIEQKITFILSLDNINETTFHQRQKILKEFSKVREIIAFYSSSYSGQQSESDEQFYQGYLIGKKCSLVLYDASQIPVNQVKKALKLNLNEHFISPYLLGIKVGWGLAVIKQILIRYFPA